MAGTNFFFFPPTKEKQKKQQRTTHNYSHYHVYWVSCVSSEAIFLHLLIETLMFYSLLIRISGVSDKSNQTASLDIPLTPHLQTQQGKHLSVAGTGFMGACVCAHSRFGLPCMDKKHALLCVRHISKCGMLGIFVVFAEFSKSNKQNSLKRIRNIFGFLSKTCVKGFFFFFHRVLLMFSDCIFYLDAVSRCSGLQMWNKLLKK